MGLKYEKIDSSSLLKGDIIIHEGQLWQCASKHMLLFINLDSRTQEYIKLPDLLRVNKLELIRRNVFFLCHWTQGFQRHIASKLIRQIYSPDDILPQEPGKEKIYVLSRGKVNIETNFFRCITILNSSWNIGC